METISWNFSQDKTNIYFQIPGDLLRAANAPSASKAGKHQSITLCIGEPWEWLPVELIFCCFLFLACVPRILKHNVISCSCTTPKTGYISCYFYELRQISHFHQEMDFMLI